MGNCYGRTEATRAGLCVRAPVGSSCFVDGWHPCPSLDNSTTEGLCWWGFWTLVAWPCSVKSATFPPCTYLVSVGKTETVILRYPSGKYRGQRLDSLVAAWSELRPYSTMPYLARARCQNQSS